MSNLEDTLAKMLIEHEGFRGKPYKDTVGKTTIGIGRNLEDKPITMDEARFLLKNDMKDAVADAEALFPVFSQIDVGRQAVLCDMAFNLGRNRLSRFFKFIHAVNSGDYNTAADEMLDSLWAKQVGRRAQTLANIMRG